MFKKAVAVVLSIALVAGITGCDKDKKARKQIANLLGDYEDSLHAIDDEALIDLTVWDEADEEYGKVKSCFMTDLYAEYIWDVFETIAESIDLEYETDDIAVNGNTATLKLVYSEIDWKPVFKITHDTSADLVKDLKSCTDRKTVSGKLEFSLVGDTWKISKITNLDKVLEFLMGWPDIANPEWPPVPGDPGFPEPGNPDPEPVQTIPHLDFTLEEAISEYLILLEGNAEGIKNIEDAFRFETCGLYDITGNGIPELTFITDNGTPFTGDLYIFTYQGDGGFNFILLPAIIYQAGDGGSFIVFTTDNEIVVTYSSGGDTKYSTKTDVYSKDFMLISHYERIEYTDYDDDGHGTDWWEYYMDDNVMISESEYMSYINDYVARAEMVYTSNYDPFKGDPEYPLNDIPVAKLRYYYSMYNHMVEMQK